MSRIVSLSNNADTAMMKLTSIKDINKKVQMQGDKPWVKEYPYLLTVEGANIKFEFETVKTLGFKKWSDRFYVYNDRVNFSRDFTLLAIFKILEAKKDPELLAGIKTKSIDIDCMINKPFEGVFISYEKDGRAEYFIDWVATFEANGVPVPTVEELNGGSDLSFDEEKTQETASALP